MAERALRRGLSIQRWLTHRARDRAVCRARRVRRRAGMSSAEILAEMKALPIQQVTAGGVEEWRYCATRDNSDVVVVFYLLGGQLVDKDTFSISPDVRWMPPLTRESRDVESCLDNLTNLYSDGRTPPRRVRDLRSKTATDARQSGGPGGR